MISLSLAEIARVTDGRVHDAPEDLLVTGDAFLDSREPVPRGLFVALAGEHVDGHDYAEAAVRGGAAAVLASRPVAVPAVVVEDVQAALQRLARFVLERIRQGEEGLRVVAVTGSQGKTTAKDMLARVLDDAAPGATVATYGSFNNELGLPLTVLRATDDTRFLVLEMGARGIGHVAELCRIAPPDVSLVLNVGKAHLGEFGSREAIAQAKGELVEAVRPGGTAVLNADDERVLAMASRTEQDVLSFGVVGDADLRLAGLELDELGRARFSLVHGATRVPVALGLLGEHQAVNATAVVTTAVACGLALEPTVRSLEQVTALSRWRMELAERADGLVVINDAYNANPDSMAAALRTLAGIGVRSGRRTIAVLGEMRELGGASAQEHRAIGVLAAELAVDTLVVVGEPARPVLDGAAGSDRMTLRHADTRAEAVGWLRHNVRDSDVVLVKASRGDGLEQVAAAVLTAGGPGVAPDSAKSPKEETR